MRRYIGLVPVLLLSLALVMSAGIGLKLSHDASSRLVADELGCKHISSGTSATGVHQEICAYNGDRVIIWSFSRGSNVVYPVNWMKGGVEGRNGSSGAPTLTTVSRSAAGSEGNPWTMLGWAVLSSFNSGQQVSGTPAG